jgi:hypothetical protein
VTRSQGIGAYLCLTAFLFVVSAAGAWASDCGSDSVNASATPLNLDQKSCLQVPRDQPVSTAQYQKYFEDTYQGLDKLRGKNGLIQDAADVIPGVGQNPATLKITNSKTSPTDIGLDLIVQADVAKTAGPHRDHALQTMNQIISTLGQLPYHEQSGLFYSWYDTNENKALLKNVSSVDNIHLALALWTVSKNFPDQPEGQKAQALLNRMDFSVFYDSNNGLIHGNLTYHNLAERLIHPVADQGKSWTVDDYDYSYFGAEARSIYALGYALGLFKKQANDPKFVPTLVKNLQMERYPASSGNILRTWDGGAFQTLLPEDLINEDAYSPSLQESAEAYGPFILDQGKKQGFAIPGTNGQFFPAGYSAAPQGKDQHGKNLYAGQAGSPQLIATQHGDYCDPKKKEQWTETLTTHAAFMAATASSKTADEFAPTFSAMEKYSSGPDKFYNPGIGFSDGVFLKNGPSSPGYGKVVNQVAAVDQLFSLVGIMRGTDPTGYGLTANTLQDDPLTREKLNEFYRPVDQKLQATVPTAAPVKCN